jgi:hypothetical protein
MTFDPDEIVTLGWAPMTLRAAVIKVQAIPTEYRSLAVIVRKKEPAFLDIEAIDAIAQSPTFVPTAQ